LKLAILIPHRSQGVPLLPPLELAYLAATLEHQHIVRIYDFALCHDDAFHDALATVQRYGPDLLLLPLSEASTAVNDMLLACRAKVAVPLAVLYEPEVAAVAWSWLDEQRCEFVIARGYEASIDALLRSLAGQSFRLDLPGVTHLGSGRRAWPVGQPADLDALPFPSRHLLQLERYGLRAVDEQLQTTVLIGTHDPSVPGEVRLRNASQVALELRCVARELGIRHYLLPHVPVTHDLRWLLRFCDELNDSDPKLFWEALVEDDQLTPTLVEQMAQAGCEAVWFQFDLLRLLDSREARREFIGRVQATKAAGIFTRVLLDLQPPYDRLPALVDMTATFGIEDVRFKAPRSLPSQPAAAQEPLVAARIEEDAQRLYQETVSRQRMIDRFGSHLGPMLWRLGIGGASS